MKLFLNGNYTRVRKHEGTPYDQYQIIVESGNGEHTMIDFSKRKLTVLKNQIDDALKVQSSEGVVSEGEAEEAV